MPSITKEHKVHTAEGICALLVIVCLAGSIALVPGLLATLCVLIKSHSVVHAISAEAQAQSIREQERRRAEQAEHTQRHEAIQLKNQDLVEANSKLRAEAAKSAEEVRELGEVGDRAVTELNRAREEIESLSSDVSRLKSEKEELSAANANLAVRAEHLSKKLDDLIAEAKLSGAGSRGEKPSSDDSKSIPRAHQQGQYKRLSGQYDGVQQAVHVPTPRALVAPPILLHHEFPANMGEADPRSIDPWDPNFTCVGITLKGLRCTQSKIANACKGSAAVTIKKMRSADPGDTFEIDSLRCLANELLCPRWHTVGKDDQTEEVARSWYRLLSEARAAQAEAKLKRPVTPQRPRPVERFVHSASSSISSSPRSANSSPTRSPSTAATTPERDIVPMYRFGGGGTAPPFQLSLSELSKSGLDAKRQDRAVSEEAD